LAVNLATVPYFRYLKKETLMKSLHSLILFLLMYVLHACADGVVLDIDSIPELSKKYALPDARNLAVVNKQLLVRTSKSLQLLDIGNPDTIKVKASLAAESDTWAKIGDATFALVKNGGRLKVISVTAEGSLQALYESATVFSSGYIDAAAADNRLAVAAESEGVYLYDITDPSNPLEVQHFEVNGASNTSSVALQGGKLFVGSYTDPSQNVGLVSIVELIEGQEPTLLSQTTVTYSAAASKPREGLFSLQIFPEKEKLLLTLKNSLSFYSLANPAAPSLVKSIDLKDNATHVLYNDFVSIAYHADLEGEMALEGTTAKLHFLLKTKGRSYDGAFENNKFFVADGANGLVIVDFQKLIDLAKSIGGKIGGGKDEDGKKPKD
jgi:hypothetical protein